MSGFLGITWDSDDKDKNKKAKSSIDQTPTQQQPMPSFALGATGVTQPVQPTYSSPNNMFGPAQVQLSEEDKTKWQSFITDIYNKACVANPLFGDFMSQIDAMAGVIPNEGQRIAAVGTLMKTKGINKQQIIDACNGVAKMIDDARTAFTQDQAARTQKNVTAVQQTIIDKQNAVAQLNQEIAQLSGSIVENQNILATREYGFNMYQQMAANNVQQQIKNLSSYISE